jgi:hypothetical protein
VVLREERGLGDESAVVEDFENRRFTPPRG